MLLEVDLIRLDKKAEIGIRSHYWNGLVIHKDLRHITESANTQEATLLDIDAGFGLRTLVSEYISEMLDGSKIISEQDAIVGVEKRARDGGGRSIQSADEIVDIDVEEDRRDGRAL